jgi:hypothetical protein
MKEISAALVRAQKEFGPALKTSTNPHFRNRYAALDACIEAVIDALNTNGIMLMQNTHPCEDGVIVETIFIHESGEQISGGKLHVPASKHDAQGYGSALTYARRYSLQAACGIAPEDDDGNHASKPAPQSQAVKAAPKPVAAKAPVAPKVIEGKPGAWQLKVSMGPNEFEQSFDEWVAMVRDAVALALDNVGSEADLMAIFRNNKNIFDKAKEDASAYEEILAMFTKAKKQFTQPTEE